MPPPSPAPPRAGDRDRVTALRADLADAGYAVTTVNDTLGPVATSALGREQQLPAERALAGDPTPLAVLVRLFVLGTTEPPEALNRALPRTGADGLLALRLATAAAPDGLRAACDLRPYGDDAHDWYVVSDLTEHALGGPLPPDHVLGVGAASTTLAAWTPRPQVESALDLGTGCGVQALHLAGHAGRVVATDTSARALAFARFTAALNELSFDLRQGSLLDPVGAEQFGLVVSNPPFVITPRREDVPVFEYRDGGRTGDLLVATLVGGLADRLAPGGIAQLLANWEVGAGEDWRDRVTAWTRGTGLDAWVVQRDVQDPAQYAELWARDGGHLPGSAGYDALYAAWLDDFAARGVSSIGFGVLTLQRPETTRVPWTDLVDASGSVAEAMGPTVLAGLRARTLLAEEGDRGLLATAWRCADDVTEERHYRPGEADPRVILLRQGGGLRRVVQVGTAVAGLVSASDGTLPAGTALAAIADLLEEDRTAVRESALPTVRGLVADGLLVAG